MENRWQRLCPKYHTHSFISVTSNIEVMLRGGQQNHIISISHNIQGQTSNVASYPGCADGLNETTDISGEQIRRKYTTLPCSVTNHYAYSYLKLII